MADENTGAVGAEPTNEVTENIDAKGSDSSPDENVPWNKDPRWQKFQGEKKTLQAAAERLDKLLKDNGLDDPDDLMELVTHGKAIKGKLSSPDVLDKLIEKAQTLDKYEAYWAEQKERERRNTEDPDERADRAERELARIKAEKQAEEDAKRQQAETKRALEEYDSEVSRLIKEADISKDQMPFTLEFFGVGNPVNDIDIRDKKAVKRLISEGLKKKEAYDQAVIKAYLSGKQEITKVASTTPTVGSGETKTLNTSEGRRKAFLEQLLGPRGS